MDLERPRTLLSAGLDLSLPATGQTLDTSAGLNSWSHQPERRLRRNSRNPRGDRREEETPARFSEGWGGVFFFLLSWSKDRVCYIYGKKK